MAPDIPNIGSWLDALKQHSIFSLSEKEHDNWRYWESSGDDDFSNKLPATMVIRDGDLFVAVGSTIRALNLNQFKNLWVKSIQEGGRFADWIHQFPYKVLQTPAITYRIISLQLNGNGRLLSVAGERDLTAVILPRSGLRSTRLAHDADEGEHMEEITCRTLTVGRYYHGRHPNNRILKALWHPLSESKTHIVVLASDSILRMYNLGHDLEEPEQSFDISPATIRFVHKSTKKFSYSAEDIADDREDAVSFCFGDADEATNGWEAFSIFYVLRNGHIYVLCPVLPYKSVARRKHIEVLATLVSIKFQHAQNLAREEQGVSNYAQIELYRKQGSWLREALTSAQSHATPSTLDSISDVNLRFMDQEFVTIDHQNQSNLGEIYRQGPFIVTPQSQVHEDIDASDIAFLNTDPASVIIVTYKNGQVDELMQLDRTEPAWSFSSTASTDNENNDSFITYDLPRLTLYETLDLNINGKTQNQGLAIVQDSMYADVYYIYHNAGVHAVTISGWLDSLKETKIKVDMEEADDTALQNWFTKGIPSEICLVVDSAPLQRHSVPIIGLLSVTDAYLSYSLFIVTATHRLIGLELTLRRTAMGRSQSALSKAMSNQLASVTSDTDVKYTPLLSLPPFEPPKCLKRQQGLPSKPRVVVPPEYSGKKEIVINEDTIKFLADSAEVFRDEIREIIKAATDVRHRLGLQKNEQQRQLKQLSEIYNRINELSPPEEREKRIKALEKIARKDKKLALRADSILQKLMDLHQPELSTAEKRWIKELEILQKLIEGDSGFSGRAKKLEYTIKHLKEKHDQLQAKTSSDIAQMKDVNLTGSQQGEIKQAMEKQTSSLQETKSRILSLQNKIDSLHL
ncbi:unnamed protein product [Umbelopsis ramanniana]